MKQETSISVGYFGSYDPDYSRNRIIKKGLEASGITVLESRASGIIFLRYYKLLLSFLSIKGQISSLIIGFPGHYDVPLAYLLGKLFGKTIYYDMFASTYETYVLDRKVIAKNSPRAKFYYFLDWLGLKLADYVITDTKAHGNFYKRLYGLNLKKTILVYVGSDQDYFYPKKLKETTDILFYGSYQPLQGTDIIIKAAAKLPRVKFKMIGEGQERKTAEDLAKGLKLKNVQFVDWLPLEKLAEEIARAKICLGIFGTTPKTDVVIPNKIYDYLASAKPLITANTEAARELLQTGVNSILTKQGDSKDIFLAISNLLTIDNNQFKIDKTGNILFRNKLTADHVVSDLVLRLNEN